MNTPTSPKGIGLGLRQAFINDLREILPAPVDFLEVTPENWMQVGGARGKKFAFYADHYPLVAHGLSLSIGSPAPLDLEFIDNIKAFLDRFEIEHYSEHLSYCSDHHGHLYNLFPIPFTVDAAHYVAERITRVQNKLERTLILENVTYYCAPGQKLREIDFILEVLKEADCKLLLDVNNVYINAMNHGYDPKAFIREVPTHRIQYLHVAGHLCTPDDILLDTHGAKVPDPVWDLLQYTYEVHGILPTCLERDSNIPPIHLLLKEAAYIKFIQERTNTHVYA